MNDVLDDLIRADPASELIERIPRLVDLDAHVVEPPDLWRSRVPRRYRDVAPRVELRPRGVPRLSGTNYVEEPGTDGPDVAWWCYEDHRASLKMMVAAAGIAYEDIEFTGIRYDQMRPGCWQQPARLEDMDLNWVEAQMCFPTFPRFCGQQFLWADDKALALICVQIYNDWMVEEWCAGSAGRLIPLCLIPLWDPDLAAAEVRRNAARGVRAVCFSEMPTYLGLPSYYSGHWDPFLRACEETGTVICVHIGSGTKTPETAPDGPAAVMGTVIWGNSVVSMADLLYSGVLHRFPRLRYMYAESQVGWIPYFLERADDVWLTHQGWLDSKLHCPEPPSTYYGQIFSCFFKDAVGVELIDHVGEHQMMFETDYPHLDGTWPNSRRAAAEQFGHLPAHQIDRLARGNAIDLLGLSLSTSET